YTQPAIDLIQLVGKYMFGGGSGGGAGTEADPGALAPSSPEAPTEAPLP
ncbi:MAG: outer membrane lipid asymmetry maintenance protein MlaD, partial [Lysobacteraceae bacterium]